MKSKLLPIFLWTLLIGLSLYFYYDNVIVYFFGYRNERFGETFFENQFWFIGHMAGASCSLLLGPMQFWPNFRKHNLKYHRLSGKIYIIGTLLAGLTAIRLSSMFDCVGCRYSLFPLSFLLLFTTAAAWYAVKNGNIIAHKQFMARSYTCALAFVFVRLSQILPLKFLYAPIANPDIKRIINEWMFSILPIIILEIWMIWIPSLKKRKRG